MPTFMDIHDITGATPEELARGHHEDLKIQDQYGVNYSKYWINRSQGKLFCLCTAPNAEAANAVHLAAHGLTATRIMEVTPEVAEAFMGASEVDAGGAVLLPGLAQHDGGTRTVLFTDIVGSTDMTQRLGDEAAYARLETHDTIVRQALTDHSGREVKHTGDGIMAVFISAASAIRCGIQIQRNLSQHGQDHPDQPLRVRIGVAVGEPIERHNDFFGSTVQMAARLCAHAEPDQVLVSSAVAELCTGKTLPFEDVGTITLKGFDKPVRAFCVAKMP